MFLNISNHQSELWGSKQLDAAHQYGEIIDIPFPSIPTEATSIEIDQKVDEYLRKIRVYAQPVIMVQGEFVFTYRLVLALKKLGYTVLASATERVSHEECDENGVVKKTAVFEFGGFREY